MMLEILFGVFCLLLFVGIFVGMLVHVQAARLTREKEKLRKAIEKQRKEEEKEEEKRQNLIAEVNGWKIYRRKVNSVYNDCDDNVEKGIAGRRFTGIQLYLKNDNEWLPVTPAVKNWSLNPADDDFIEEWNKYVDKVKAIAESM